MVCLNHPLNPTTLSPLPGACVPATADTHAELLVDLHFANLEFVLKKKKSVSFRRLNNLVSRSSCCCNSQSDFNTLRYPTDFPRYPTDLPRYPTVYTVSRYPTDFPRHITGSHRLATVSHGACGLCSVSKGVRGK